jgi:hypothetical protein
MEVHSVESTLDIVTLYRSTLKHQSQISERVRINY